MSDEFDEDDSAGDNTSDESSSSEVLDENDPMVWKSRYEKSKNKFAQATVTIQSLIEQFTEYKETVEDEKNQLEEKLAVAKQAIVSEQAKSTRMNQETIANLQTLMIELEMIETKNQELNEELLAERTEHERCIGQLVELRSSHAALELEVSELKIELAKAKAADDTRRDVSASAAPATASSRIVASSRKERPGGAHGAVNRFSTMRDANGTIRAAAGQYDMATEVQALKAQKAELRDKLEIERKKLIDVLGLVRQLSIVVGADTLSPQVDSLSFPAATAASAAATTSMIATTTTTPATTTSTTTTTTTTTSTAPANGAVLRAAFASGAGAGFRTAASSRIGSVVYRRQQQQQQQAALVPALGASGIGAAGNATQLAAAAAAATSASVSETTERIRVTIDKIAEHDKEPKGQLDMTMKRNGAVVDDACFESSLAAASGRVTALLTVGSHVWVACANGLVDVFAVESHVRVSTIRARSSAIALLVVAADYVWLAFSDGSVSVYTRDCVLQDTLAAHGAKITGMVMVENNMWTCGADLAIRIWQTEAPFACRKEIGVQSLMTTLLYHLGMVWVGTESAIVRWNTQSFRRLDTLDRNGKPLHSVVAMVSVSDSVWSLSGDNMVGVWTVLGDCVKIIEHSHRMLGLFTCSNQVWITSQNSLLIYSDHAVLLRQIKRPHDDTPVRQKRILDVCM